MQEVITNGHKDAIRTSREVMLEKFSTVLVARLSKKKSTKLSQYRPLGFDCNFDCSPYSETACLEVAKKLKRKLKKGNKWSTKGCYWYGDKYSDEYDQFVYYGTGGDEQAIQAEVTPPKLRPEGFDCQ